MRTIKSLRGAQQGYRGRGAGEVGGEVGGGGGGVGGRVMVTRLCMSAAGVRNVSVFCKLTYKSYSKRIL